METKKFKIKNSSKKTLKNKNLLNIIFDLDETLVQTLDINFTENKNFIIENPNISNMSILNIPDNNRTTLLYIRPYFLKLIEFCFRHFNVSFWTAGTSNYCNSIINILLTEEQKQKTKAIIARVANEDRKIIDLKSGKIYCIYNYTEPKPLNFLWNNEDFSSNFNKKNTIIIDNSYNVTKSYSYNSILVESYCRLNDEDDILLILKNRLFHLNRLDKKQSAIYSKKKKNINVKNYRCRKLRMPIIKSLSYKNIEKHLSI
jgi:hypothetical protein